MRIFFVLTLLLLIAGCADPYSRRDSNILQTVSHSFEGIEKLQISKTPVNSFSVDNDMIYEYNRYNVEITSVPSDVEVKWGDESIGLTPITYTYSGRLAKDDLVSVVAIPPDARFRTETQLLSGNFPLPRKINFILKQIK